MRQRKMCTSVEIQGADERECRVTNADEAEIESKAGRPWYARLPTLQFSHSTVIPPQTDINKATSFKWSSMCCRGLGISAATRSGGLLKVFAKHAWLADTKKRVQADRSQASSTATRHVDAEYY
jgi:hypothetical protein